MAFGAQETDRIYRSSPSIGAMVRLPGFLLPDRGKEGDRSCPCGYNGTYEFMSSRAKFLRNNLFKGVYFTARLLSNRLLEDEFNSSPV